MHWVNVLEYEYELSATTKFITFVYFFLRSFLSCIHDTATRYHTARQYYFAESNSNAALSYVKAVATLTDLGEEVTEENAISFSKGKTKLPAIGKATAQRMLEFAQTGTFAKLEEKRLAHA